MYFPSDQHLGRGTITRVTVREINDEETQQTLWVDGMKAQQMKDAYRAQGHGLSTVPPVGSEGIAFSLAGRPDQTFFLESEHKDHRPKGQKPGDSVLYDAYGNTIKMEEGAVTHTNSLHKFEGPVEINGDVTITGAVDITGELTQTGGGKIDAGDVDN